MKRRLLSITLVTVVALSSYYSFGKNNMAKIEFELGKNIVGTAKASGVPRFQVDETAGLIDYSINQIPANIPAQYTRPGYEISVSPLFAFTMYADRDKHNNLAVTSVTLQLDSLKSHEAGRAFVEQLLAQFKKGKWKRYIDQNCPAVSGRSSLLDADGTLNTMATCSLDPDYKLTEEEWLAMMAMSKRYQWIGEGIIAELSIGYAEYSGAITYKIFLEFEDEQVQVNRYAQAIERDIKEGEAKGWNTAAEMAAGKIKTAADIKLLEEKALQRGDQVVPR